jgi:hypothetical protein
LEENDPDDLHDYAKEGEHFRPKAWERTRAPARTARAIGEDDESADESQESRYENDDPMNRVRLIDLDEPVRGGCHAIRRYSGAAH